MPFIVSLDRLLPHARPANGTRVTTFGSGLPIYREGDTLVVLYGCRWPVVLRKDEEVPGRFKVVGVVFVHGAMNGETFDKFEEMNFVLS
jgi:hypothetical protein